MTLRILAISCAAILFHTPGAFSQSASSTLPSFTQTAPSPTSSARSKADSKIEIFWKSNWHWFLIGILAALVPILLWAILGPGRRWYRARKYKSAPIQWDRVGSERFQSPSMREIGGSGFSRSRGSGSSTTSSRLALSLNAAAPGEQDIETAAAIASPKAPSTYIQRERRIRNDSTEAVIGLVQPQIHSPRPAQALMPPSLPADRNSTGSLGPPDPHVHRAHPKYNTFQRYSRQHKKRVMSVAAAQQPTAPLAANTEVRQESMNLLQTQISHRKPVPSQSREFVPTAANLRASQQIFLPQPPKATPYHIRQGSYHSDHNRSASWHNTVHRGSIQNNSYGLQTRHVSMDGYHPVSEPMIIPPIPAPTQDSAPPRRSTSRGRLQKPQHMNPRNSTHHTNQKQPEQPRPVEEPRMSFYRTPQSSRESLGRPRASSNPSSIPDVPPLPQQPAYPKLTYPARSAMSSKIHQRDETVYGTESSYSYSISAGNPPVKSVKFAAIPQLSSSAPTRVPIRHF